MIDRPLDGLGASDAAAILGVSKWRTALDVFNDKMGISGPDKKQEHQQWGLLLEPALAARYTQDTGRRLRRIGTARSKDHPLLYAHPDRVVLGEPGLVEIKVSYRRWDEIPIYYKTQAIQQLICTDREWVDFAVLEGGQRFNPDWRYERNRDIEADFIAELEEWWQRHIVGKEPPEMDGGKGGLTYLRKTYPANLAGTEVVATASMLPTIDRYRGTRANREQAEREEERLKQEVMRLIGDASYIVGPFGKITWTRFLANKTDWKSVALDLENMILKGQAGELEKPADWRRLEAAEESIAFIKSMHSQQVQSSRFSPAWQEEKDQ